jgi:hypothetical protein
LGFLGIENRKPKIVNFFLSFQAGNYYQKYFILFYFSCPRGCGDSRGGRERRRGWSSVRADAQVRADAGLRPRRHGRLSGRTPASVRTHRRICADAIFTASSGRCGRGRTSGRKGRPDGHFHPKTSVMTSLPTGPDRLPDGVPDGWQTGWPDGWPDEMGRRGARRGQTECPTGQTGWRTEGLFTFKRENDMFCIRVT